MTLEARKGGDTPEATVLRPRDAADVAEILRSHPRAVEPLGAGSKRSLGGPVRADVLDLAALAGILDYEPAELVLTARAATPLADVEALLAEHGQRLAFEPPNFGALLGAAAAQTLGGVLAANSSGSRRLTAGAARDHFLGFKAVTGDGLPFKGGGRVVKNVTGYDLPKLLAGSWGTLAVLTEVSVRVVPAAEAEATLILPIDSAAASTDAALAPARSLGRAGSALAPRAAEAESIGRAVAVLTEAVSSCNEVSAAAFDPVRGAALRVEGLEVSVRARVRSLLDSMGRPEAECLEGIDSRHFWQTAASAAALADQPFVWRLSVPPSQAARVVAVLKPERYLLDWAGGLLWGGFATFDPARVRAALRGGGYASLWRAPAAERAAAPALQAQSPAFARAAQRLKAALDPHGKLNPGRLAFG